MTGDQLKRWRENRKITQENLAAALGWTRDKLANVESERTTMAENIQGKLAMVDEALARAPAPNQLPTPKTTRRDYAQHRCWDLAGNAIAMARVSHQPIGYHFYRLDSSKAVDELNGHQLANLYEKTRKHPYGQCTYFQLDVEAWEARCVAWKDNPVHIATLPKLNAMLVHKRNNPVDNSNPQNYFAPPS